MHADCFGFVSARCPLVTVVLQERLLCAAGRGRSPSHLLFAVSIDSVPFLV